MPGPGSWPRVVGEDAAVGLKNSSSQGAFGQDEPGCVLEREAAIAESSSAAGIGAAAISILWRPAQRTMRA